MGSNLEAHYQHLWMTMGLMTAKCAKSNVVTGQCLELINVPHGDLGSNGEMGMTNIPFSPNIANSRFGSAFWSWMLFSNNSSPCGRPKNPISIVDLLDFLVCHLMNLIGNEALWLTLIYQPMSRAQNQPTLWNLLNQDENKGKPNPKSRSWNKKTKTRTWHVWNNNPIRFYCKEEIKIKQGYDKKTYPKLVLNKLKVMRNSTFIYTHLAPSSNLHVAHVWTKTQMKMNLNLTMKELKVN